MADDTIRRAQAGDRRAFDTLVRRSARRVYAGLLLETRDRQLADDLTQETFVRAWKALGTLRDPTRWDAWLTAIATTVRLDAHKASRRHRRDARRTAADVDPAAVATAAPDAATAAERSEDRARLLTAVDALPEPQRSVIALRYLGGVEATGEIADALALGEGAVRGLLYRGLAALRRTLSTDNPNHSRPIASVPPDRDSVSARVPASLPEIPVPPGAGADSELASRVTLA